MDTNRSGESGARGALRSVLRSITLDNVTDLTITVGLGVLLAVGFASSYTTLLDLAVTAGGYPSWLAPAVPLSFDLGIVVLSLKVVRAAREGRTAPVLRLLVVVLSVATVAANASAAHTLAGAVLHAVPPAMFVVCFESVIASTRRHALERLGLVPPKLPRVRGVRWMLAPLDTFRTWRGAVLERDLFEQPSTLRSAPLHAPKSAPEQTAGAPTPLRAVPAPKRRKTGKRPADLAAARSIADELGRRDVALSQRSLSKALRDAGYTVSAQGALDFLAQINRPTAQEA